MKKLGLFFSGVVILSLMTYSCTKHGKDFNEPDEEVNLKGKITSTKDERGTYNVTHLLNYLHGYIRNQVSKEFRYYEDIPERKNTKWFFENFKNHLNEEREADKWLLENIKGGEVQILGTTVSKVDVVALIFPEDLDVHHQFKGKKVFSWIIPN
ncbi:hypothetical protein [Zobellia uliginosa]|uniref:hypothetical protein n=1 Tax=Zobellia uliginosa TaxID=143224 RepID=UPI0026E1708E|nr:hypothetical protein [Zobellia uliginosa]MDO6517775.1 hypothetical protein [Zobellia uliginosa]